MSLKDVAREVDRWQSEGRPVALATVVSTWGSGPRRPGAKMAHTEDARIAGSVSGGCVEAAVVEEGRAVLAAGRPKLLHFGVADETAWEVGLSCGGAIEVFVEPLTETLYQPLREAHRSKRPIARATVVSGPALGKTLVADESGVVGEEVFAEPVLEAAREALAKGRSERLKVGDEWDVFIDVELPPPTLVMVGGVHIAIALAAMARSAGYRAVVVDPRRVFGSEERFGDVDGLYHDWPDEALEKVGLTRSTAVATLTHDPKLDDPALRAALRSPAFYVGALGSRKTHERRRRRLLEQGLTESELERLHAPIGLRIGARNPEEIALSILGQIVAARNGVTI